MATSSGAQTDDNPYFKTYLRDHKDIQLPKHFGKINDADIHNPSLINCNRTDYKTLPKVKLFTIKNVLTATECDTLVHLTSDIGYVPISFEYPQNYRKCHRVICKTFNLASVIWNKIIPYLNRRDIEDLRPYGFGNKGIWRPTHINEAIRFTRYTNGDFFKPHRDGGYTKSNLSRSVYTIMIYLNDAQDFKGGDTVFYSLKKGKEKDSDDPQHKDLFLNDSDKTDAITVRIKPIKGMCVIFNHDVWHEGEVVTTKNKDKYKYILRSDIMFECYDSETFNRDHLMADPLYIKAQKYYKLTIDLQNEGKVQESTVSYLKALSIQTTLPSVIVDKDEEEYYGDEYYWFSPNIYEYIFSFIDVFRLVTVCYVCRAWNYYGTSPTLWKNRYTKYFNINEIEYGSRALYDNMSLLRPWKHIFSYRFMIKKDFPIIVLNIWLNGIEVATTSKRNDKINYNNDQELMMNGNNAQYIPFATAEYKESNMWSWKPYRKEILYGRIIFTGSENWYGFRAPKWVIDGDGVLNGLLFHTLFKQILYFPNCVLCLPSIMYDNRLFMLYLKYMLTKFNSEKYSSVFCVMIKNMEQEIAKYYQYQNCIVILNEHRSFSVSVIKNGERIVDNKGLIKKYIATQKKDEAKKKCFPSGYFHYRDDYDSSYCIANVSNFDFISSVYDKTSKLKQNVSLEQQRMEATPHLEPYRWSTREFNFINASTTCPIPIITDDDDVDDVYYYEIGKKDDALQHNMQQRMKNNSHLLIKNGDLDLMNGLMNDMFVGPNKGKDIPQNDDFKYLTNRWDENIYPKDKHDRGYDYYSKVGAPICDSLCYSAFDLILALNDVFKECSDCNVFTKEEQVPVIMVGPLTNFYGEFISQFCGLWNEDGFKVKYVAEYVQNEGTTNIKDRSSALKQILQSIVNPQQISNFKSVEEIKNEIMPKEQTISTTKKKSKLNILNIFKK